jgi:hypothetical protein
MTFQQSVGLANKVAIKGDRANQNPTVYSVKNFLAGENGVEVGGFVFRDATAPETQVVMTGSSVATVEGFVERVQNVNGFTYDPADMTIAEGENVTVARKGDFYAEADDAVSIGDKVYTNYETGATTFTSGAKTIDTGFTAKTSAAASGDMVIISNW